jgi:hypothetical protein
MKKQKSKFFLFALFIFLETISIYSQNESPGKPLTGNNDFDSFISSPMLLIIHHDVNTPGQEKISSNFFTFLKHITNNELSVVETEESGEDKLCYFDIEEKPTLYFSKDFIKYNNEKKSISMSLMMFQISIANFYFNNIKKFNYYINESTIWTKKKIDGCYIIGTFVSDYLDNQNYSISKIERILERAVNENNFIFSEPLLECNADIINEFYSLYFEKNNDQLLDSKISTIYNKYCYDSLKIISDAEIDESVKYSSLVDMKTFISATLDSLSYHYSKKYTIENISDYNSDIVMKIMDLNEAIIKNIPIFNKYSQLELNDLGLLSNPI